MGESIDDIVSDFLVEDIDTALFSKDFLKTLMDLAKKKSKKNYRFEEDEFWQNYYRNYIYQSCDYERNSEEEQQILLQNIDHLF